MQETNVNKLTINKLTKAQYDSITPSETELYFVTDDSGLTSADIVAALGYTPYNTTNPSGYQANVIETIKVNGTVQTVTTKTVDISIPAAPTVDQTYNASSTNAQSGTAVAQALTTKVSKTGDTMTGTLKVTGTYGTVSAQGGAFSIDGNYEGFIYQFYIDETGACLYHGSETVALTSGNFSIDVLGDIELNADGSASLTGSNIDIEADSGSVTIAASNGNVEIDSPHLFLTSITETYTTIPDQTAITAKWLKDNAMPLKQDVLVSGTNIKTINGNSILGNGDITIQGGGTVDQTYNASSTNAQSGTAVAQALSTLAVNENTNSTYYAWTESWDGNTVYTAVPYEAGLDSFKVYDSNFNEIVPLDPTENYFYNDRLWFQAPSGNSYYGTRTQANDLVLAPIKQWIGIRDQLDDVTVRDAGTFYTLIDEKRSFIGDIPLGGGGSATVTYDSVTETLTFEASDLSSIESSLDSVIEGGS